MEARQSLKNTIYNSILQQVMCMHYRPGQILTESSLVETYGCSKAPVREALLTLCAENVLRNIPRCGYEVLQLTLSDIAEMLQFRFALESGILCMNMERITDAHLEQLIEVDARCQQEADDLWRHWDLNTEFHLKMMEICGNSFVVEELRRCMDRMKRAYVQCYYNAPSPGLLPEDTRYHAFILQSLLQRDPVSLKENLRHDLNAFGGHNQLFF